MPPKKANPFMCFVMEWKEKNAASITVPEAVKRCGSLWEQLPEKKKNYYKEKAKNISNIPGKTRPKLTSDGTPVEFIEKQQRETQQREELMIRTIKNTVNSALNSNNLLNERFYFISFNYFARQLNSDIYIPAEVAVAEFSLKNGISRTYHAFINPKDVLYANVYSAKDHAETTHQLPLPPEAMGDKDLKAIFFDIAQFIKCDGTQAKYPPLYTLEAEMAINESCLDYLQDFDEAESEIGIRLKIYSIQHLFYNMKLAACEYGGKENVPTNKCISDAVLDRDFFEYESDISCAYHEDIDRTKYCPLSKVIRWGYYFADYMGKDFNLNFTPGKHLPNRFNAEKVNKDVQEAANSDTASLASAVSHLSLDSDFMSYGATSSTGLHDSQPPKSNAVSYRCNSPMSASDIPALGNPWKRHETSVEPQPCNFEIRSANNSRRSFGRGIALIDDDFPILDNGRGRGFKPRT